MSYLTLTLLFLLTFILYKILMRMYRQFYRVWYYTKQGIPFCSPHYPILGNQLALQGFKTSDKMDDFLPYFKLVWQQFGKKPPGIVGFGTYDVPYLLVSDPVVI
jgi:hypothetical protein